MFMQVSLLQSIPIHCRNDSKEQLCKRHHPLFTFNIEWIFEKVAVHVPDQMDQALLMGLTLPIAPYSCFDSSCDLFRGARGLLCPLLSPRALINFHTFPLVPLPSRFG